MVTDHLKTVTITGAVSYPGDYGVNPGTTTVKDVVSQAGGLLYYASNQAEITRVTVTQSGPKTDISVIDLAAAMEGDPRQNIPLERNDYLFVRAVPEWSLYRVATITGEVKFPGAYTFKKGKNCRL